MANNQGISVSTAVAAVAAIVAAVSTALQFQGGSSGLHPLPRVFCTCEEEVVAMNEGVARCQLASDFLIALAYFSIPLELLYFFQRAKVFPHRWVLLQFGLFIVLCGLTHVVNLWTYGPHSHSIALTQTILKAMTAAVSCATAFLLVRIIPALLKIKVRELFLQHKAAQLDKEVDQMRRQEEVGRHVRLLTQEIRQHVDRHTILHTAMLELSQALLLDNCTMWMVTHDGVQLELTHELERRLVQAPALVPLSDPTARTILSSPRPMRISPLCPLGAASLPRGASPTRAMAAVRLPTPSEGSGGDGDRAAVSSFGLMVLVLHGDHRRQWRPHEVAVVEEVGEQVGVALAHAQELEESQRVLESLSIHNLALKLAKEKAEGAVRARNDFLAVMSHEMRTPLQAMVALTSLLKEDEITLEQSQLVDTVARSSTLLSSLISDVLEFSRLEEASLVLEPRAFELPSLFREAASLAWPDARAKGLDFSLQLGEDVCEWVIGDERRLLQMVLNVTGAAVKWTDQGKVCLSVSVDHNSKSRPPQQATWEVLPAIEYTHIKVEVTDTGKGLTKSQISRLFQPFGAAHRRPKRKNLEQEQKGRAEDEGQRVPDADPPASSEKDTAGSPSTGPSDEDHAQEGDGAQRKEGREAAREEGEDDDDGDDLAAGLGLAICQKLVELMHGSMWVESERTQKGRAGGSGSKITFIVRLQMDSSSRHLEGEGSEEEESVLDKCSGELAGLRVLVVDDNRINREAAALLLQALQCEVTAVESGADCLARLASPSLQGFDAVLLDMCMPQIDGFEVVRRVNQMFRPDERPLLVALTARTDKGMRETCLDAGMDAVLFKPTTVEDLGTALCELMATDAFRSTRL